MSRAEELANELFPEPNMENYDDILIYRADRDNAIMGRAMCYKVYEQAEKDLIPLINRLCEAILFDWDNKAELAWEIQSKIKEEKK